MPNRAVDFSCNSAVKLLHEEMVFHFATGAARASVLVVARGEAVWSVRARDAHGEGRSDPARLGCGPAMISTAETTVGR